MNKFCAVFLFALLSNIAFGSRHRRQTADSSEEDLEDRYGWNANPANSWQRPTNPFMRPNNPFMRPTNPNMRPVNPWDQNPGLLPNPNPIPTNRPTTSTTQSPGGTSTESAEYQACIRSCPVTSEYNPVCGSNGNTYDNPGRLSCAQMCGLPVTMLRQSRCPAATTAPTS